MSMHDYKFECAPGAFTAIHGGGREQAARILRTWSRLAGLERSTSTNRIVLAAALIAHKYPLEPWSVTVGGWRTELPDAFAQRIWRRRRAEKRDEDAFNRSLLEIASFKAERKPRAIRRAVAEEASISTERFLRRELERYSVNQWLARRQVGTWVLLVYGHVMVARSGRIIAGDTPCADSYGAEPLEDAWRVLPRRVNFN